MLRTSPARVLDECDEAAVHRLLATDPVAACVLAGRIEMVGTAPASLGAPLWGLGSGGELEAGGVGGGGGWGRGCGGGATFSPSARRGAERGAPAASAERARRAGRRCSTIV